MADEAAVADGVDLATFVRETLVGIVSGIRQAKEDPNAGPFVSPVHGGATQRQGPVAAGVGSTLTAVEFDIAITATSATSGGGKAGIRVLAFDAGGEGRREVSNQTVSRVRFGAMLELPGSRVAATKVTGRSDFDPHALLDRA